jgi:hypothetical protein
METIRLTSAGAIPGAALDALRSATSPSRNGPNSFTPAFLAEDRWICERAQRGMQSRHSGGGLPVELERPVGDFHPDLGARLFGQIAEATPETRR